MLYTIMNLDDVFFTGENPVLASQTMQVGGKILEGYREEGGFVISRMISTNPADYLDERFFPGQKLR